MKYYRRRLTSLQSQTASIRDAWVEDIRSILWEQAIRSREKNIREKANMGIELHSSYIHLGPRATVSNTYHCQSRGWAYGEMIEICLLLKQSKSPKELKN